MEGPVYLHVRLKVVAAELDTFYATMKKAVPIIEGLGWTFVGAWVERVGRLHTVVDLWELRDANQYFEVLSEYSKHPDYPEIMAVFNTAIEEEVVNIMTKVPYGRL
jgi:hypothetical protein